MSACIFDEYNPCHLIPYQTTETKLVPFLSEVEQCIERIIEIWQSWVMNKSIKNWESEQSEEY